MEFHLLFRFVLWLWSCRSCRDGDLFFVFLGLGFGLMTQTKPVARSSIWSQFAVPEFARFAIPNFLQTHFAPSAHVKCQRRRMEMEVDTSKNERCKGKNSIISSGVVLGDRLEKQGSLFVDVVSPWEDFPTFRQNNIDRDFREIACSIYQPLNND